MIYSLQDAKARFSELVGLCLREGAQTVTRHGQPTVVMVSYEEYSRLTAPRQSLGDFFRSAPRVDLPLDRSKEDARQVSFL